MECRVPVHRLLPTGKLNLISDGWGEMEVTGSMTVTATNANGSDTATSAARIPTAY
jgi:hypothetical protein